LARPATGIRLTGAPLVRAVTAVGDDGSQILYATSQAEAYLWSFGAYATRVDLAAPREEIIEILAADTGWLVHTADAIVRVDAAWREVDRSAARPQHPSSSRWLLRFGDGLVWFELASLVTTSGGDADQKAAVRLCATWLTPALDVTAATCTALNEGGLSVSLPQFPAEVL
jgi:hypothetical protein